MAALMAIDAIEETFHPEVLHFLPFGHEAQLLLAKDEPLAIVWIIMLQIQKPRIKELVGAHSICVIHLRYIKNQKKIAKK